MSLDLSILNANQKEAVKATEGPVMVMAGAGSGKTRVLTYRIAYLIDELGVSTSSILAVTFTNKAANEMKERIDKLIGVNVSNMWVSTFHSFGARFLRKEIGVLKQWTKGFIIIDDDDENKIIKKIIKDDEYPVMPKEAIGYISAIKNNDALPEMNRATRIYLDEIYDKYQEQLLKENLLDFDDLIMLTVRILKEFPAVQERYKDMFSYILVDEFQDTNSLQYELINLLVNENRNVFVVGDINQSIYAFRGAKVENVYAFKRIYDPRIIKLEQNYRSTGTILNIANDVIEKNESFVDMKLFTESSDGQKAILYHADSYYGEVSFVIDEIRKHLLKGFTYKDFAILYRLNSLSLSFETEFIKYKMPYVVYGGVGYYERKEVKDLIAYLRLIIDHNDNFSFKRIVNTPKRKIGDKQIEKLNEIANEKKLSLYEAISYTDNVQLNDFKELINDLYETLEKMSLVDFISLILDKTGYLKMLEEAEEDDRIDNILQLKSVMKDLEETYQTETHEVILSNFLADLALKTDVDKVKETDEKIKLMNYHQAKGLEYPVVFMVAMEDGIFPPVAAKFSRFEMEEERRICYVGVTRAKSELYLTYANSRRMYGKDIFSAPSEFLNDIKPEYYEKKGLGAKPVFTRDPLPKTEAYRPTSSASSNLYKAGDKVEHKVFGVGVVVAVTGPNITVAFAAPYGIKVLLASHPSITKKE